MEQQKIAGTHKIPNGKRALFPSTDLGRDFACGFPPQYAKAARAGDSDQTPASGSTLEHKEKETENETPVSFIHTTW